MAKYIVTRTSLWNGEKPVEEATPVMVHWYCMVSGIAANTYRKGMREKLDVDYEDENGNFGGYEKESSEAWLCEIPSLEAFVDKYGRIVLSTPENKEGYYEVEIYDQYRE